MIALFFVALMIQFVLTVLSYANINLKVTNPNCKEEVKNVKQNKLAWRLLQTVSFILLIIVFILIQL